MRGPQEMSYRRRYSKRFGAEEAGTGLFLRFAHRGGVVIVEREEDIGLVLVVPIDHRLMAVLVAPDLHIALV